MAGGPEQTHREREGMGPNVFVAKRARRIRLYIHCCTQDKNKYIPIIPNKKKRNLDIWLAPVHKLCLERGS